jgi:replicative DNA helicase
MSKLENGKDAKVSFELIKLRKLPQSVEAEAALLGGLLLDSDQFEAISKKVCAADFSLVFHRDVFELMNVVYKQHGRFDPPMIIDVYANSHKAIYELVADCASTANLNAYADIVREKSVQRQLIEIAENTIAQIEHVRDRVEHDDRREHMALFLEEVAAEFRAFAHTEEYILGVITELNLAMVRYHDELFMCGDCDGVHEQEGPATHA